MNLKRYIPLPVKRVYALFRKSPVSYLERRKILRQLKGNEVECNLCRWEGERLMNDSWHEGTICPNCYSDVRHRLLMAAWLQLPEFSMDALIKSKDVLHFAPEPQISAKIRPQARTYLTADFHRQDVDRNLDITSMNSIATKTFDLVIACDVLEHVDDRAALKELHRILKCGGTAILSVPQKDHAQTTHEDDNIVTPEAREKAFGQSDHLRIYGKDFIQRVEAVGFHVTEVNESNFRIHDVQRYVMKPPKLSQHPLATNYRGIFFAKRTSE